MPLSVRSRMLYPTELRAPNAREGLTARARHYLGLSRVGQGLTPGDFTVFTYFVRAGFKDTSAVFDSIGGWGLS